MVKWARVAAVLAVGWAGAAFWAYGVTVLHPTCEQAAITSCTWTRDVRWGAILAVCAALAVAGRRWSVAAIAVLWLVADLALERADLGRPALVPAAVFAACLVTAAAVLLGQPPRAPRPPRPQPAGVRVRRPDEAASVS